MVNFEDLRAILHYVPQFQGETFVIAIDGAVVESPDFSNLLLDLAVLRSLNIHIVLVHGASAQIEALGESRGVALSSSNGVGPTDEATLEVSMDAISRLTHRIMQSLTTVDIRAATANAIRARPSGVIRGRDMEFTGVPDVIDAEMLESFISRGILPVIAPLGFSSDGSTFRVNSDAVAREVALALGAAKILYLSIEQTFLDPSGETRRQWSSEEAAVTFNEKIDQMEEGFGSKVSQAIKATRDGIPRVHLIGIDQENALLSELFSNEGIGLMVFADDYHRIRLAEAGDADEIYSLIRRAVEDEQLLERSKSEIISLVGDYQVLTVDGHIVGCVAIHFSDETKTAELACLFVKRGHTGVGYGSILVEAALTRASQLGAERVIALSTQAAHYLEKRGFRKSDDIGLLPKSRQKQWSDNGRNAVILVRDQCGD